MTRGTKRLGERETAELREAFELFDSEKSGKINLHELKVLLRALGFQARPPRARRAPPPPDAPAPPQVKKTDVIKMVHELEPSNEGSVDFLLFSQLMAERYAERDPEEEIMKAFQLFDNDGSGKISLKNMRQVARELGEDLSEEELQAMIEEFDRDQDGEISQEEFLSIMRSAA
ncbi:Ca2-binding protein [Aureococcus anophagefferens]|nr:Ca2-binding protein [Aureococcus anophagefferens]